MLVIGSIYIIMQIDFVSIKVSFFCRQNHYIIPVKNYIIHTYEKRRHTPLIGGAGISDIPLLKPEIRY